MNWLRKILRPVEKIKIPEEVVVEKTPLTFVAQFGLFAREVDVDSVVRSPVFSLAIVPLYCSSCNYLFDEIVAPTKLQRELVGVQLSTFFKDSHLPPSLIMERIYAIIKDTKLSNYAQHDLQILMDEFSKLDNREPNCFREG